MTDVMATAVDAKPEAQPANERENVKARAHIIDVEKLIIHKYDAAEALLRKADKVARDMINGELRDGEYMRVIRPGRYQLVFPKLRPDAGQLRTSVISEMLFRAIRDLNPAVSTLDSKIPEASATTPDVTAKRPTVRFVTKPAAKQPDDSNAEEMRRAATQAIERMSSGVQTKAEELLSSAAAQKLLASIAVKFQPIWNVKKQVVNGYRTVLTHNGGDIDAKQLTLDYDLTSIEVTHAILDAVAYRSACAALTAVVCEGEQFAILTPVHFSTVDHSRFVGAYLDAGNDRLDVSKRYITFEFCDPPTDLSRYRLREAAAYLRGRSRSITICLGLTWNSINLSHLKEVGISSVGLDLRGLAASEPRLMKVLEEFAARCESAGMGSYCCALDKFSLLSCGIAAGLTYAAGRAIAPPLSVPRGVIHFDLARLLSMTTKQWNAYQDSLTIASMKDEHTQNTSAA